MAVEGSTPGLSSRGNSVASRVDWGNAPQWVSAICALAIAGMAVYGLFFSATSQALVAYLQSELVVRNQRIAGLELRERELQLSVATTQSNLSGLTEQKLLLDKKIAALNAEQIALSQKVKDLSRTLSNTEFSLVKEKIGAKLSSTLGPISVLRLWLSDELDKPAGVRARTERVWDQQLDYIQQIANEVPERDRPLALAVVSNFIQQCDRLSKIVVQVPALRIPKDADYAPYNYNRGKHPTALRLDGVIKQIEKAERDIENCFHSVTP